MENHTYFYWIHQLLPALKDALTELEMMPERDGGQFALSDLFD